MAIADAAPDIDRVPVMAPEDAVIAPVIVASVAVIAPVAASNLNFCALATTAYKPVRSSHNPVPTLAAVGGVTPTLMLLADPGSHRLPVTVRLSTVLSESWVFFMPPFRTLVGRILSGCWFVPVSPG